MKNKSNDAPLLLVDWSVISYKNWHKMRSVNYEPETGREDMEFSINMYLFTLFLIEAFQPHETVFAVDSRPNWREEVYKKYYLEHLKLSQKFHTESEKDNLVIMEKEYIAQFDQKVVKYWYSDEAQKWMMKKLNKGEQAKVDWDEYKSLDFTEEGFDKFLKKNNVPGDNVTVSQVRENYQELIHANKREILYKTLKGLTPAYKGNRSSTSGWDYATPKNGYYDENNNFVPGFRELADGLAESLAGTFNAKVVKAEDAEADDIIAHYVKRNKSGRDIILVSVDSDLHQLFLDSMFFKFYNPNIDEEGKLSHYGGFASLNKTNVMFKLRQKLLSGDSSDNIPGCGQFDEKFLKKGEKVLKSTLVGEKTAEKWLTEKKLKEIVPLLDPKAFARNRKLIHLENIPDRVNRNIAKALSEAKIPKFVEHEEYLAPPLKILTTRQAALFRRGDEEGAEELESRIDKLSPKKEESEDE